MQRYAEQASDDLVNCLGRLKLMSDAYSGIAKPMDGVISTKIETLPETYDTQYGKYQQFVDLVATQVMAARDDLETFRKNFL
jgi:hypothetical protein